MEPSESQNEFLRRVHGSLASPLLSAPAAVRAEPARGRRSSLQEQYKSPKVRSMGIFGSVASVMNAVIGTGILALPVAFSRLGLYLGTVVILLCAGTTFTSLVAFGQVVTEVGAASYGEAIELAVGPRAGTLMSVVVGCFCYGICVVYSVVISQNLTDLLNDQGWVTTPLLGDGPLGEYVDNRRFFIICSSLGVLIPLCMLPNFDMLKYAAIFASCSMGFLASVVAGFMFLSASRGELPIWSAGIGMVDDTLPDLRTPIGPRGDRVTGPLLHPLICCVPLYDPTAGVPGCAALGEAGCCAAVAPEICCTPEALAGGITEWGSAEGWQINSDLFSSASTFLFAFLTHTMVPQVVAELVEPSTPRIALMMGGVCTGSLLLYTVVGLSGYLLFGTCVCDNISISFGKNPLIGIGQGCVVLSVCCGYPTLCWPCRDALLELVYPLCGGGKANKTTKPASMDGSTLLAGESSSSDADGGKPLTEIMPDYLVASVGKQASEPPGDQNRGGSTSSSIRTQMVGVGPSLAVQRITAIFIVLSSSAIAWFDPPFSSVVALLGALGNCLCGLVMPPLAYMQVYHAEKPLVRRIFMTRPGWCFILSIIFYVANASFVLRNELFDTSANPGDVQDRTCAPPEE